MCEQILDRKLLNKPKNIQTSLIPLVVEYSFQVILVKKIKCSKRKRLFVKFYKIAPFILKNFWLNKYKAFNRCFDYFHRLALFIRYCPYSVMLRS